MIDIDRRTAIVANKAYGRLRAVQLSAIEFGIFLKLHGARASGPGWTPVSTRALLDGIYSGVKEPPVHAFNVLTSTASRLKRKLEYLGLTIITENHKDKSWRKLAKVA